MNGVIHSSRKRTKHGKNVKNHDFLDFEKKNVKNVKNVEVITYIPISPEDHSDHPQPVLLSFARLELWCNLTLTPAMRCHALNTAVM